MNKRIIKNTISMLVIRVLTPLTAFILFMFISRIRGTEDLGKYSVLIAFLQIVQFLPILGLQPYIVREVSKNRDLSEKFIANLSSFGAVFSLVVGAILYIVAILMGYPQDMLHAVLILSLVVIPNTIALIYESVLIGHERMDIIATVIVIENILKVAVSIFLILNGFGIGTLIIAIGTFRVAAVIAYRFIVKKIHGPFSIFGFDMDFLKMLICTSPVFLGMVAFSSFINRVDFVILSKLRTFTEVGFYTVAYKILEVLIMLPYAFLFALFPLMSRLHKESKEELKEVVEKAIKYLFAAIALMISIVFVFPDKIITLIFSDEYIQSIPVLKVLIIMLFFISLDMLLGGLLIASNRQKLELKVQVFGLVVYAGLLFLLIPFYGILGAAYATVIAMAIQASFRIICVDRFVQKIKILSNVWKPVVAAFVAVLFAVNMRKVSWILAGCTLPVMYTAVLIAIGGISKGDIAAIKTMKGSKV
jgi:O-antigen/teichoic acid export membrane protein